MKDQDESLYYVGDFPVPETPEPGQEPKPWKQTRVIGKPMPRVDAYDRVSGSAVYPSDVTFSDVLYGVVLGSPHANARVRSVDVSAALKMPGVHAAVTRSTKGADLTWPYVWGKGKAKLFDAHCRYEGDAVAGICAETPYQACDAARAIKVDYEVLPFVSDERKALDPKAPAVDGPDKRIAETDKYERGDVDMGFAEADVVL